MKPKLLLVITVLCLSLMVPSTPAAEKSQASAELKDLVGKVETKLRADKKSEADLAPELKGFDDLLAKHKDEKTDEVAQILLMKAMLYLQVLGQPEKGVELVQQLKRDFPKTTQGRQADNILEEIKAHAEAKKVQAALVEGARFPDFEEKDVAGKPLSVSNYKGKVVLIDFWATWCGPCVGEMPNVLKTYEKHHSEGFEVIGISLDQNQEKLTSFTNQRNMPWQQYFDGKGWSNKLARKYGIQSIPATFLLDGEGKIIGKNLRGEALEAAVAKALPGK